MDTSAFGRRRHEMIVHIGDSTDSDSPLVIDEDSTKKPETETESVRQCEPCNLHFIDTDAEESHSAGHCPLDGCLDHVENASAMQLHVEAHMSHPNKPFRCENCRRRYAFYSHLKRHRETMCKMAKRPKCPQCHRWVSAGNMARHAASHVDRVSCSDCGETFAPANAFKEHMAFVHGKEGSFQCGLCPRRFRFLESVMLHMDRKHNSYLLDRSLDPLVRTLIID